MSAQRPDKMTLSVHDAITGRQSIRAYLGRQVPRDRLERVLTTAGRAPSGSNIQPWKVYVLEGAVKDELCRDLVARHEQGDEGKRAYNYGSSRILVGRFSSTMAL